MSDAYLTPPAGDARAWRARVWHVAWPIIVSNGSVPLVGAVDTAVVGHLPDPAYIGAVAVGAMVFSFLYWGFGFLRMGTGGFAAQAFGAGDFDELRAVLGRALGLAGVLGLAILALQAPVAALAIRLLEASADVEGLALEYFTVRVWSAPFVLANYAVLGLLIGIQDTRSALVIQLIMNVLNVVLDLLFVMVLDLGVPGVAAATVISECAAACLGAAIVARRLRRLGGTWRPALVLDRKRVRAMVTVNTNIMARTLCLIFAFAYFTWSGARLGDVTLAANAVLMHLMSIMAHGLDGFAHAAEALAGGACGRRDRPAFDAAVRASTVLAGLVAAAVAFVYAIGGTWIVSLLTDIEPVRETARVYLWWLVLAPVVSVWSFQLDGIFIGATRTAEMRNAMAVSLAGYLLALHFLVPAFGNHGLWASLMAFMALRAITLALAFGRIGATLGPA